MSLSASQRDMDECRTVMLQAEKSYLDGSVNLSPAALSGGGLVLARGGLYWGDVNRLRFGLRMVVAANTELKNWSRQVDVALWAMAIGTRFRNADIFKDVVNSISIAAINDPITTTRRYVNMLGRMMSNRRTRDWA